jgi:hypothetical protein
MHSPQLIGKSWFWQGSVGKHGYKNLDHLSHTKGLNPAFP